jgi:SOS-response transcriptional repressor LexA
MPYSWRVINSKEIGMELKPLTQKQAMILNYVIDQIEAGKGQPTIREVGAAFDMETTGSVCGVFRGLITKGYIIHVEKKSRGHLLNPDVFSIQVKGRDRIKIKPNKKRR